MRLGTIADGAAELRLGEATCLVAGAGIGGGIMAVPYLAVRLGFWPSIAVMAVAYLVTVVLHIMVAELSVRTDCSRELLTIFTTHLFRRRAWLRTVFYGLMAVTLVCNLAAYISGSGDILASVLGWPGVLAKTLFFLVAAAVVFLGLKSVAINEVVSVVVMVLLLAPLVVRTIQLPAHQPLAPAHWAISPLLAVYGMAMFALSSLFAVPQAASGLRGNRRHLLVAVSLGLAINLAVMIVIMTCTLASSSPVTEVAIVGWAAALGGATRVFGSVFIVLAMMTTFWSISLQLSDITRRFFHAGRIPGWLIATVPSFALALAPLAGFLSLMQIAGGATAVIVAVMAVPAYTNAVRDRDGLLLGPIGRSRLLYAAVMVMYLVMAIASFQ